MKLNEVVLEQEQLDEIKLKHALAGAALAGAVAMGAAGHKGGDAKHEVSGKIRPLTQTQMKQLEIDKQHTDLTNIVLDKYKIAPKLADEVVTLTKKHEDEVFPKAEDLLAVIGIESSFRQDVKSNLKYDKAVGLTQIRPKIWGIKAKDLKGNIEKQIKMASDILKKYYAKLGSKDKAIHAYNVGLTNVRHNKGLNPEYVAKWKNELKRYKEVSINKDNPVKEV